ncbi:hypothetical protein HII36_18900 [Nonomuraea sp. NN258]|uniref:hypothetical protein n=1 Tax=Nonomuraea antri TaxID=2730852 RepID=UPI001569B4D0|nr:hypothetical protein [Nonomuraea antri]NRQ33906.1 hypothetical protein [Nonomuraea antri]
MMRWTALAGGTAAVGVVEVGQDDGGLADGAEAAEQAGPEEGCLEQVVGGHAAVVPVHVSATASAGGIQPAQRPIADGDEPAAERAVDFEAVARAAWAFDRHSIAVTPFQEADQGQVGLEGVEDLKMPSGSLGSPPEPTCQNRHGAPPSDPAGRKAPE